MLKTAATNTTGISILDQIVGYHRARLPMAQRREPLQALEARIKDMAAPRDFARALRQSDIAVIAEIKKASPSAGVMVPRLAPVTIARRYVEAGAAAISILTEPKYFRGDLLHLLTVRRAGTPLPLLRKDFIFDPYQVYQARAYGADAFLLITAVLEPEELKELIRVGQQLGMTALVEVHDEDETERALAAGAQVVGINNRDLRDFSVDLDTTRRLRRLVPLARTVVSESGIRAPQDIARLREWGVNAVLIGETLVTAPSPREKLQELLAR